MPSWLDGLLAKAIGAPPGVHLGAFGKHPGWDDHVEPIGLDSEPLVAAREILYVRGIGGVIDTALWDKKPEEVLPQIEHLFCWTSETDTLVGRMWASTDGKGRSKYPMAAVAHFGLPFSYTLAARTARVLSDVESRCKQAGTASEVRAVFATGLELLRAALAQPPDELGAEPDRAVCSRLAREMWLDQGETFPRVLYALQDKARSLSHAPKASGKISLKMLEGDAHAEQTRLPMSEADLIDGIAFWHKVIAGFAPMKRPVLYLHPVGCHWVDVVAGTPTARQLYALRANETALPLASAVPYELDPAFRAAANEFIGNICYPVLGNAARRTDVSNPPPLPNSGSPSPPTLPF